MVWIAVSFVLLVNGQVVQDFAVAEDEAACNRELVAFAERVNRKAPLIAAFDARCFPSSDMKKPGVPT